MLIKIYSLLVSPFLHVLCGSPFGCRFMPSCSQYAAEAIHSFGFFTGGLLGLKRVLKCHPFSQNGYDPVPTSVSPPFQIEEKNVTHNHFFPSCEGTFKKVETRHGP